MEWCSLNTFLKPSFCMQFRAFATRLAWLSMQPFGLAGGPRGIDDLGEIGSAAGPAPLIDLLRGDLRCRAP